jgi:hypothetical protein
MGSRIKARGAFGAAKIQVAVGAHHLALVSPPTGGYAIHIESAFTVGKQVVLVAIFVVGALTRDFAQARVLQCSLLREHNLAPP